MLLNDLCIVRTSRPRDTCTYRGRSVWSILKTATSELLLFRIALRPIVLFILTQLFFTLETTVRIKVHCHEKFTRCKHGWKRKDHLAHSIRPLPKIKRRIQQVPPSSTFPVPAKKVARRCHVEHAGKQVCTVLLLFKHCIGQSYGNQCQDHFRQRV
ncbi:hypothetical protein AVEN_67284-1 [Araneus ventricosus]|uniref:Uncharacterized protein n=1 Tax=Araneus ventricosus TaxID=182803 RepID=A0A4Y2I539_ARAVE|nr:hypothetical protein AVEN_67284-1 [Araneus ventricosus]